MLVELYQAGLGDGMIADLGTATELEAAGYGEIVFRHLDSGGSDAQQRLLLRDGPSGGAA